jgi:hypothetical protein
MHTRHDRCTCADPGVIIYLDWLRNLREMGIVDQVRSSKYRDVIIYDYRASYVEGIMKHDFTFTHKGIVADGQQPQAS